MFHRYWATAGPNGTLPRDMAWRPKHEDKARLRRLYHEFLRDNYPAHADGLPEYPAPDIPAKELNDDESIFIADQEGAVTAKSAPAKPAKKLRNPRAPRASKSSAQRAPRRPKKTATAYSPALEIGTNGMSRTEYNHLAAEDDGGSVKSETNRNLQMIEVEGSDDVETLGAVIRTDGLTIEDAIIVD